MVPTYNFKHTEQNVMIQIFYTPVYYGANLKHTKQKFSVSKLWWKILEVLQNTPAHLYIMVPTHNFKHTEQNIMMQISYTTVVENEVSVKQNISLAVWENAETAFFVPKNYFWGKNKALVLLYLQSWTWFDVIIISGIKFWWFSFFLDPLLLI